MSAWAWGIAAVAYLLATAGIGKCVAYAPLRPLLWLRRRSIAQVLCDEVEFFRLSPDGAWREYTWIVGGLSEIGKHPIIDAFQAAHHRYLWRETIGHGLDIVSEIPDRLVLTKPHTTRAA